MSANALRYWICAAMTLASLNTAAQECVVLLHGLARGAGSMSKLADALSAKGYAVVNHGYDSTNHPIETLAEMAVPKALAECPAGATVHFVTHSMGGILVRQYLSSASIDKLGRVVMLGPPNQGSEVVDKLRGQALFRWLNGPAGLQLGTDAESVPKQLGPVEFELGVIAGTRSINLLLSTALPNPDDGKVSVASTRVEGMADHLALPVTHPLMMRNSGVIKQVLHFLEQGSFKR